MNTSIKVFKIGGKVVDDARLLNLFLKNLKAVEGNIIIIHGGGKKASEISERLNISPQMVEGRRITDGNSLEIVTMVYGGLINKNLVARLQSTGINAIGLSGADANLIVSHKRKVQDIDYGFVGDIDSVNSEFLLSLCRQNIVPVICPLTHDGKGQILNTNADTIASSISTALSKHLKVNLVYGFELNGVLSNYKDKNSVIPILSENDMKDMYAKGVINEGMIPKLKNGFDAMKGGVKSVSIRYVGDIGKSDHGTTLSL